MRDLSHTTDTHPLRILHVLRAPLGGLFRHVRDLAEAQSAMGHDVGIVCDATNGGEAAERQIAELERVCTLGVERLPMSRTISSRDVTAFRGISRLVAKIDPDVVHGHGAKGGAYARLLPRRENRVTLYTPHGGSLHFSWFNPVGAVFLGLERLLSRRGDGLVFESEFGARVYASKVGRPKRAKRIVPNGLGSEDFAALNAADAEYDAVFVGELRTLKGVRVLIEAVAALNAARPFRIAIAGSGPDEAEFRALAEQKGVAGKVDFLGHCAAREVFAKGRMIVVPSLAESFPYVVLEAAASGKPVIATKVGGIPEIFGPYSGALVPAGDATALASAMGRVLERPISAKALAESLRQRAKMLFSAARMAEDVTRFYGELRREQAAMAGSAVRLIKLEETPAG